MVLATTFTVAMPVIAKAIVPTIGFQSWWFFAALASSLIIVLVGTWARAVGELQIPNPKHFNEEPWRSYSKRTFKERAVYWAGQHTESNIELMNMKGLTALTLTAVFILEAICMVFWILFQVSVP